MTHSLTTPRITEIDTLLQQAECLKFGNQALAAQLAGQAVAEAEKMGDPYRYARGLVSLAWSKIHLGQIQDAVTITLQALRIVRKHGFLELEARVVNILGILFATCMPDEEINRVYTYQLELSRQLGSHELEAMALNDMGVHCGSVKGDIESLTFFEQAASIMPPNLHNGQEYCLIMCNLASAHADLGQFEESFGYIERALEIAEKHPEHDVYAYVLYIFSMIQSVDGNFKMGDHYLSLAEKVVRSKESIFHTEILLLYSDHKRLRKDYAGAVQVMETAYEYMLESGFTRDALETLNAIKALHEEIGDRHGILRTYERITKLIPRIETDAAEMRFKLLASLISDNRSKERREEYVQSNGEILRRISHEFRTPLTVIQSSAEMMDSYGDLMPSDRRHKHLHSINAQVRKMTRVLENVSALIGNPATPTLQETVSQTHNDVLSGVMCRLRSDQMAVERIHVELRPRDLSIPESRSNAVVQVAYQLLHNALRYSDGPVLLTITANESTLSLAVEDTGNGISQEEQAVIFEPMARNGSQLETAGGGLGLAIVSKLVSEVSGTIDFISAENQGTVATVTLPV